MERILGFLRDNEASIGKAGGATDPAARRRSRGIGNSSFLCADSRNNASIRAIWNATRERKGNVALLSALLMPAFLGIAGLGTEVSNWGVVSVELQRGVDNASQAAALVYNSSTNAQTAANAAADIMELNKLVSGTRTWNATSNTLTEGNVTIQKVSGIRTSSDTAFTVSFYKSLPMAFSKLFVTTTSSMSVSAQSWSELVSASTGAQPCVTALGTTSTAVQVTGGASISGSTCSVRSNGGIYLAGSGKITAEEIDAGSSISINGGASVSGTKHANDGTIADPYASNSAVQTDIKSLSAGSGTAWSSPTYGTATISPGTYSSITTQGSTAVTLSPGLYIVNGPVHFGNGSTVSAAGVTIVSSGTLTIDGSVPVTWSSPTSTSTSGGIPGVAYVSTTTGTTTLGGSGSLTITGVLYTPNSAMSIQGAATYGATSCLEVVVNTLSVVGSGNLGGSCSSMGTIGWGSSTTTTVALVQ